MRQARRAYRHLPVELHEQAFEHASVEMRTGASDCSDRRGLYAELAASLDEALKRIHVGWCLNQARAGAARTQEAPAEPVSTAAHPLTGFLENALGGLERAVLQLELGAGRDSHTVRAALRLSPLQYARHREIGLGKLRGAIAGNLAGKVCSQHLDAVTLAATGDRDAGQQLTHGRGRCRACAREATGLRHVIQERLALTPWPLVIKPAGFIVAKLGAVSAVLGGKSAAAGGLAGNVMGGSSIGGAKFVAAVIASAAVATGGVSAAGGIPEDSISQGTPVAAAPGTAPPASSRSATDIASKPGASKRRPARKTRLATSLRRPTRTTAAAKAPAGFTTAPASGDPTTSGPGTTPTKPTDPIRKAVEDVRATIDRVTNTLPAQARVVDETLDAMGQAVDDITGAVDGLPAP